MESAATGRPPRFLGKLQNRNRRVRTRQASEDGHGAALGRTTDPGQQGCRPIVGRERRRRRRTRRPPLAAREGPLGSPAGAHDDVRFADWEPRQESGKHAPRSRVEPHSARSLTKLHRRHRAPSETEPRRRRLLGEDRGSDARRAHSHARAHGSTKARSKLSSTAATK